MQLITIKENVECQRLLLSCEISWRSQWPQSEYLLILDTFSGGTTVSSNQRRYVVWPTVASQCFPVPRVANFPTSLSFCSCVTMDGNLASVHSACSRVASLSSGHLMANFEKFGHFVTFGQCFWPFFGLSL